MCTTRQRKVGRPAPPGIRQLSQVRIGNEADRTEYAEALRMRRLTRGPRQHGDAGNAVGQGSGDGDPNYGFDVAPAPPEPYVMTAKLLATMMLSFSATVGGNFGAPSA